MLLGVRILRVYFVVLIQGLRWQYLKSWSIVGEISKSDRVVVISTANGLKFTDFLHKYHTDKLEGISSEFAYAPIDLPADYEKVRGTILNNAD